MAVGMTVPMVAWMLYRRVGVAELGRDGGRDGPAGYPFLCLVSVQRDRERSLRRVLRDR
jgi:hypothetical protein